MARANREQYRYAYKERRTELHTNPFGRLGTGDVVVYDVTPGPEPSVTFRKLLEKNGKPVLNSKPEREERKVRREGPSTVDDTVATLQFAIDRRESAQRQKRDRRPLRAPPRRQAADARGKAGEGVQADSSGSMRRRRKS